jgi:hypothetical protein
MRREQSEAKQSGTEGSEESAVNERRRLMKLSGVKASLYSFSELDRIGVK